VSHHVEAILTRLEVDNRVQAARELNRDTTPS
jgi:DNA-binding NarL/FixJ family response regulator